MTRTSNFHIHAHNLSPSCSLCFLFFPRGPLSLSLCPWWRAQIVAPFCVLPQAHIEPPRAIKLAPPETARLKNLTKRLRQIDMLASEQASGQSTLTDSQLSKIGRRDIIAAEIAKLTGSDQTGPGTAPDPEVRQLRH